MSNLAPKLAYFRLILAAEVQCTPETIRRAVADGPFSYGVGEEDVLVRHLEASFDISQRRGSTVRADYRPWLESRRPEIDFFYWDRLKEYFLGEDLLPPQVVSTLGDVTDEVLDYSGNPADERPWKRRGMVIGHVQSGKTTNYAGLICKAADAGYQIVILLAGITNSLRQQTQERMDEYFIGQKSVFNAVAKEQLSIANYASAKRFPAYGTSRDRDFSKVAATTGGVTLAALREPLIFVTKKNKATLENLADWLSQQHGGKKIHEPLLLIDDEADNASINTFAGPERVTAINKAIRRILSLFARSTYVGYTATPFANIFIDPESADAMLEDDLFPQHFIKALDPPSNYVGADRVFGGDKARSAMVVEEVADFAGALPLNHKKACRPSAMPASMERAVRVFVLACALRDLRGGRTDHCSMMINVSRFNDVQEHVQGLVYAYLQQLRNALVVHSGVGDKAVADPNIRSLKETFEQRFGEGRHDFRSVLVALEQAAARIRVVVVNMKGGTLDYKKHKLTGLRVIAIGGLALSRGLTLEGLVVSYVLRNAGASDTLMQMARWFGYRPGYEDLCHLYLPGQSIGHYEYVAESVDELRSEVKRMEILGLTPERFGLRVRQSPLAIRITAANKMRSATSLVVAQDYSGRHIEGYALKNDARTNEQNMSCVQRFANALGAPASEKDTTLYWPKKAGADVLSLLQGFEFSDSHPELGRIQGSSSLFADFVADRITTELAEWDVAVPAVTSRHGMRTFTFGAWSRWLVRRHACEVSGPVLKLTSKNKAANPGDERIGLTPLALETALASEEKGARRFCMVRERPLLLVHVVDAVGDGLKIEKPVVTLSFCMPATGVAPVSRTYQVNTVYRQQMLDLAIEAEDDDQLSEGNDG